jgi:3-deoxy-manno-octulosonate cytidylyltransferase (CMP-KDO synthetase)
MKSFLLIIPARLKSTRFPNKLLKKINGKEILKYVYDRCKLACKENQIVIATPDKKIIEFCNKNKINFVKTSENCQTGTDRVLEISKKIKKDFYINVQGDEIFVSPNSIKKVINKTKLYNNKFVINAFTNIKTEMEFRSLSVPKVVMDNNNFLLYMSRGSIPLNKKNKISKNAMKQVCIYGYPYKLLKKIPQNKKGKLEKDEDIEILRFLENSIKVKMIKVEGSKIAIDTRLDFIRAKKILKK